MHEGIRTFTAHIIIDSIATGGQEPETRESAAVDEMPKSAFAFTLQ